MVREAQQHAQEDRQQREEIETRNRADSLAYQAERTLKNLGEKITASLRSEIEEKIKAVRDALSGTDITRIRQATEELEQNMQRVGQEVYSQSGAASGTGTPSGAAPGNEPGTVEGEFHEV